MSLRDLEPISTVSSEHKPSRPFPCLTTGLVNQFWLGMAVLAGLRWRKVTCRWVLWDGWSKMLFRSWMERQLSLNEH